MKAKDLWKLDVERARAARDNKAELLLTEYEECSRNYWFDWETHYYWSDWDYWMDEIKWG